MTTNHTKGKPIEITLGQDTACYWTGNLVLSEAVLKDEEKIKEQVIAWAKEQLDSVAHTFEPEFDFSNPRVVCATVEGKTVLANVALGARYHDSGLHLGSVFVPYLAPSVRLQNFVAAVEELGHNRNDALQTLVELAELARAEVQNREAANG